MQCSPVWFCPISVWGQSLVGAATRTDSCVLDGPTRDFGGVVRQRWAAGSLASEAGLDAGCWRDTGEGSVGPRWWWKSAGAASWQSFRRVRRIPVSSLRASDLGRPGAARSPPMVSAGGWELLWAGDGPWWPDSAAGTAPSPGSSRVPAMSAARFRRREGLGPGGKAGRRFPGSGETFPTNFGA